MTFSNNDPTQNDLCAGLLDEFYSLLNQNASSIALTDISAKALIEDMPLFCGECFDPEYVRGHFCVLFVANFLLVGGMAMQAPVNHSNLTLTMDFEEALASNHSGVFFWLFFFVFV